MSIRRSRTASIATRRREVVDEALSDDTLGRDVALDDVVVWVQSHQIWGQARWGFIFWNTLTTVGDPNLGTTIRLGVLKAQRPKSGYKQRSWKGVKHLCLEHDTVGC